MTRPISYRLRRSLAAGTATLAMVTLAGCGGDDSPSTASDDTSSSQDASASASTSASTSPSEVAASESSSDAPEAGTKLSADEFGAIIKNALDKATTANVTLQSGSTLSATGQVDFTTDPSSAQMHAEVPQVGDLDVVLVDGVV